MNGRRKTMQKWKCRSLIVEPNQTRCRHNVGMQVLDCRFKGFISCTKLSFIPEMNFGSERLCFWGAPHIFQIKYSVNMSGKVDLLKTWEGTTTLLMWLWPVRMISRWKLTRWSWLGRYSFIDYFTVIITSRSLLRSRQEAAAGRWWSSQPGQG